MESAKVYPLNRNRFEGGTAGSAPETPPKPKLLDQVRQAIRTALSLPNGESVRSLDQAVYFFPQQAPPGRNG